MTFAELVQHGINELTLAGVPDCEVDVYLLLSACSGKSRTQLFLAARDAAEGDWLESFYTMLERRKQREPVAYILGEQEFWSRPLKVTSEVLIPRPETEFLLETVFSHLKNEPIPDEGKIIDLCCGSGIIAITLALELERRVTAIDLSSGALNVSQLNSRRLGVADRVSLVRSDLFNGITHQNNISLVVSNPPYVSSHAVAYEVEPEVCEYEPKMALDGGEKGLDLIERIRNDLPDILCPGGRVFMEIGYDQGEPVAEMFTKSVDGLPDFCTVEILKDYAGMDRVLYAKLSTI